MDATCLSRSLHMHLSLLLNSGGYLSLLHVAKGALSLITFAFVCLNATPLFCAAFEILKQLLQDYWPTKLRQTVQSACLTNTSI